MTAIRAPRVSAPDLPDALSPAAPSRRADLLAAAIACSGETDLAHASLEQCLLTGTADRIDLTGAMLIDVRFTDLRTPVLTMRDASVRRLSIDGGRIGALDLSSARIAELEIRGARIDYLSLGAARGEDILVVGSTLRALDLPHATLSRLRFDDCQADEVDSRGLSAKDVDLRGLHAVAYLDVLSLRGTTLSPHQVEQLAPAFAAAAGIDVQA
ncbi:MAG: pentapeptide repeat-containing protein [Microbacterium sp.]